MGKKRVASEKKKKTTKKKGATKAKKAKSGRGKLTFKKRMSKAERMTHYNNLILNFGSRYNEAVKHEAKMLLARELIKALRYEVKRGTRTVTHVH
jgi:hypothetical protein